MRYFIFTLIFAVTISCSSDKKYQYIQLNDELGLGYLGEQIEKPSVTIEAETDSIAYLEAYTKFVIAQKVFFDMDKAGQKQFEMPTGYKLLDEKGNDITNTVFFDGMVQAKSDIDKRINSMENSLQNDNDVIPDKVPVVDKTKIASLIKNFKTKRDEYSNDDKAFVIPKSAPNYSNYNGLYLYFQLNGDVASNLRLKFQYAADDWLFFEKIRFLIDGVAYEYTPDKTETDHDSGKIWEWSDQAVTILDKSLVEALANAKSAKMKIEGRQYYREKVITSVQIKSIKETLELYRAFGADF